MITIGREQKQVPKEFKERITRVGGRNRFDEPMYRVVWGRAGDKYQDDCWHLEKWVPGSFYGNRESWERMAIQKTDKGWMDVMGPYPERGEYEEVTSFAPVELTMTFADYLVNVMETSRHYGHAERRSSLYDRQEKADKSWDRWADDVLDDAFPAFHGVPHVSVPHNKGV